MLAILFIVSGIFQVAAQQKPATEKALHQPGADKAQHQPATDEKDTTGTGQPEYINIDSLHIPKDTTGASRKLFTKADTSTAYLVSRIEDYTLKLNKVNSSLKRGFDTTVISEKMDDFDNNIRLIEEFVYAKVGVSNHRSLSLSKILLTQMEKQLKQWQESLFKYSELLVSNNDLINGIKADSMLKKMPGDSTLRSQFYQQILVLSKKWIHADTVNKTNLYRIAYLQNRVSVNFLKVGDMLDNVDMRMRNFTQGLFIAEYEYLWKRSTPGLYDESVPVSLRKSFVSNTRVFKYYNHANPFVPLIFILIGLVFYWWTTRNLKKIRNSDDPEAKLLQSRYLAKSPLVGTLVVAFTLAPFVYAEPPMLYVEFLMLVALVAITWFGYRYWKKESFVLWVTMFCLFVFFAVINLMVTTTGPERWALFLANLFSLYFGLKLLQFLHADGLLRMKKVGLIITNLFIVLQAISLIANLAGRYSLAKICSVTAIFGLSQGFAIFYFIEILLDAIYLELESHRDKSGLISFFDFQDLDKRLRNALIILGITLWSIITLRNLNVYDFFYTRFVGFFQAERQLGNTTFSFWSIAIFVIVLLIASFLSKIIGYIFGNPGGSIKGISKSKMGSGILLIRLGIYSVGIIFAFVASGLPMDKITIIIGALGVGIGFGLQNIVNNLVSGVILAFEKPIQIGDVVEIGTRIGVVNEIGIRSSKISTYDGSTVIIPNGDMIAQHIVNWTHGNRNKRIESVFGVAYGTNISLCQKLINEALDGNKYVMYDPKPSVLLQEFGNNAINLRVLFWTNDIGRWVDTRSEIMGGIYQKFTENGISFPFPQQDLHIRSIHPEVSKAMKKDG